MFLRVSFPFPFLSSACEVESCHGVYETQLLHQFQLFTSFFFMPLFPFNSLTPHTPTFLCSPEAWYTVADVLEHTWHECNLHSPPLSSFHFVLDHRPLQCISLTGEPPLLVCSHLAWIQARQRACSELEGWGGCVAGPQHWDVVGGHGMSWEGTEVSQHSAALCI